MKYKIIKAIDVAGLNFLTPIVRLCYGEEPQKQLKLIGQFIVVPFFAILVAVGAWYVVSDSIQTKSGKLPNQSGTWDSAKSIWTFHKREKGKERAFDLTGEARAAELERVEKEIEELAVIEKQA
ncbi:MAG: hypothetical protein RID07_09935, partial [Lacipirellulaceae bacterium]